MEDTQLAFINWGQCQLLETDTADEAASLRLSSSLQVGNGFN
jgi:hypothetical protein